MIERILPGWVEGVEAWGDEPQIELFAQEELAIERSVERRRREFTTARACARTALQRLGVPAAPILPGARGEPRWPSGVVGSITHCEGYRACAVARCSQVATIGIDAEPNAALPRGLIADIASPEEEAAIGRLRDEHPAVSWDRLLFSAKEAVYKAWFPLAESWLGFQDAVLSIDSRTRTFSARLLVAAPLLGGRPLDRLEGRWVADERIVLTAIVLAHSARAPGSGMLAPQ
jgi:4'-phosphopantetheinyl transferase EntD